MKIEIEQKAGSNLLSKICLVLFGVFLSSLTFSASIQLFSTSGLWVGIMINLLTASLFLYYFEPGRSLRLIAWSILATLIASSIAYIFTISYLSRNLESML